MNIGQRINDGLAKLLVVELNGPAVDTTRDIVTTGKGGHGTHKERGKAPAGNARPLVEQWAEQAQRVAEGIEEAIREIQTGAKPQEFGGIKPARGLRSRIHDYEGRGVVYVAYHERCSVELVRKVRAEKGRDAKWGYPKTPQQRRDRALTRAAANALLNEGEL